MRVCLHACVCAHMHACMQDMGVLACVYICVCEHGSACVHIFTWLNCFTHHLDVFTNACSTVHRPVLSFTGQLWE